MFTAVIGIDGEFKSHVRAVVVGDHLPAGIDKKLRPRPHAIIGGFRIGQHVQAHEAVGRVTTGPAAVNGRGIDLADALKCVRRMWYITIHGQLSSFHTEQSVYA